MKEGFILAGLGVVSCMGMLAVLNSKIGNKGEAGGEAGAGEASAPAGGGEPKTFTQDQVNHLLAEHKRGLQTDVEMSGTTINELQVKLKSFEDAAAVKIQNDLEANKEYDKLKEGWVGKEGEYKTLLSSKDATIQNMVIENSLTHAVIKQNAHSDVVQLVKALAEVNDKGEVRIKGKNANGIEELLSVEEGLKAYLKDKPYLVKANGQGGGGTPPPAGVGGGNVVNGDPLQDAKELQLAMNSGDRKKVTEIKARIAAKRATVNQNQMIV